MPIFLAVATALSLASCSGPANESGPSTDPSQSTSSPASSSPTPEPLADLKPEMAYSASIPSMCEFPAGKLVDGKLKAKHKEYATANAPSIPEKDLVVAGDLNSDGVDELAAAFYCDLGGVAWPAHIQLFENTAKGIAPLGKPFKMAEINGGARGVPSAMKIKNGKLSITDAAVLPGEPSAMPTGKITVVMAWNGKKLVPEKIQDLASADNSVLDLKMINGSWCPGDSHTKAQSPKCIKIAYPFVTNAKGEAYQIDFGVFEGVTFLSYSDAPMGMLYKPGEKIEDPANPQTPQSDLNKLRLYNSQTGEFYVKDSK